MRRLLGVRDVAVDGLVGTLQSTARPSGRRSAAPAPPAPQVSGAARTGRLAVDEADRRDRRVGAERRRRDVGGSQACSGTRPTPDDIASIAASSPPAVGACPVASSCSAALGRQHRPQVPGAVVRRRPRRALVTSQSSGSTWQSP